MKFFCVDLLISLCSSQLYHPLHDARTHDLFLDHLFDTADAQLRLALSHPNGRVGSMLAAKVVRGLLLTGLHIDPDAAPASITTTSSEKRQFGILLASLVRECGGVESDEDRNTATLRPGQGAVRAPGTQHSDTLQHLILGASHVPRLLMLWCSHFSLQFFCVVFRSAVVHINGHATTSA